MTITSAEVAVLVRDEHAIEVWYFRHRKSDRLPDPG
jgi:hypothetical protein